MIVLGIDTATAQVGCAIAGDDGPMASFHASLGRRHAETLAPAIQFVCRQAGVALSGLDAIAVDVGPGLFTGLRVGLATAKALAAALGVPMVGLTSLEVLAAAVRSAPAPIAAIVDARRGEVYWALFQRGPDGTPRRLTAPAVAPPGDVAAALAARREPCLAVGDGARRYAGCFGRVADLEIGSAAEAHPSAAVLASLACGRVGAGLVQRPDEVAALYLRSADTRINWETAEIRVAPGRGR